MRRALREARRASGRSSPNPPVGAVLFRGGRVLGRGATRRPGGAHAEVAAIEAARRRFGASALRGASLAVTLEPCCHRGRTGPCTDALRAAGVAEVLVGHLDPQPEVAGRGVRRLRRAGIQVRVGVLEEECRDQHRGYLSRAERGRPFVALKLAATLDGRIATARGESRWLTGERARARVHALRAASDAVAVGSGTARADDPALTVRRAGRPERAPVRVLVDSRLAVPRRARLFTDAHRERTWVLCAPGAPPARRRALETAGVRVLPVPRRGVHLDLARALERLAEEGLTTLLVEGGSGLAAALLRAGRVDELHWFVAPALLGGDARPALASLGVKELGERLRLRAPRVRRLGEDLYLHGRLEPAARAGAEGPAAAVPSSRAVARRSGGRAPAGRGGRGRAGRRQGR